MIHNRTNYRDFLFPQVAINNDYGDKRKLEKEGVKEQYFESLLKEAQRKDAVELKISNHAQKRLEQRQISLTEGDLQRVNQAVENARAKGARDALVLYNDLRMITSVSNRTIVTVLCGSEKSEDIFTNIDSVVIVND